MFAFLTSIIPSVLNLVGKGADIVDKKNQQQHDEQTGLRNQVIAEVSKPNATFWDSFVDGINRLVRPCFTFGTLLLFVWAAYDPITFSQTMVALQLVPEYLWAILGAIVVFWFGQRALEGVKSPSLQEDKVQQVVNQIETIGKLADTIKNTIPEAKAESPRKEEPKQVEPDDEEPVSTLKKPTLSAVEEWKEWQKNNGGN